MISRNRKGRLVCAIVCVLLVLFYWFWFCAVTEVNTGQVEWEEGQIELNTAVWRNILSRKGYNKTQGCTYPKLDPWGPEVMKYVSSLPKVRHCNLSFLSCVLTGYLLIHPGHPPLHQVWPAHHQHHRPGQVWLYPLLPDLWVPLYPINRFRYFPLPAWAGHIWLQSLPK